jgi:isoleucyl-tRNA synthetase
MKEKYYPEIDQNLSLSKMEEEILNYWNENKVFERTMENRKNSKDFVFYDGPPFASGLPHYGHLTGSYVKDTFARYHTIIGEKVDRDFGWDCHGLPAEMGVEKESGISGRKAIEVYGIDKFNELCRTSVVKYVGEWKYYVNRIGRWVNFDDGYKTMDLKFMESVIWAFKQLYDKGLLYEDFRVMPYSWACQTPLSNFETKQDNSYREKADKAVTIKFKLKEPIKFFKEVGVDENSAPLFVLAWTTTPWTLPSNLALTINKEFNYVIVKKDSSFYIILKESLSKYKKELGEEPNIIIEFSGEKLLGLKYEPLFDYLVNLPEVKACEKCYTILTANYVTTTDGTGIVHTAPGFGEDDNATCKIVGIPTICPVDDGGKFIAPIDDYIGMQVFETNELIIIRLKEEDKWLKTEQYLHNYPHCWRTDTPLIYRALSSWYVKVEAFKDRLIKNNQTINWVPSHLKNGRFGKWLEGAKDWSITRNRFWGCPVPVWKSSDPKYPRIDVYGSIAELEKDFGTKVENLHRPYIDNLTRQNPDDPTGKSKMVRVTDVMDCWFESGSMPYAQFHYPFENKEWFEKNFPADFITEGDGQLRGWFYTLLVMSTALFDKAPFKNCISFGVVVDETGKKLSKRLKNYVDPLEVCNLYSSDTLRWFIMRNPILKGEELKIDKEAKDIKDALRMYIKPIMNSYNFFCMYANSDGIKAIDLIKENKYSFNNSMDKYILSKMKQTIENIKKAMDEYVPSMVCKEVEEFFEVLNNWYIRRNKNRFWKAEIDDDKLDAYNTLYTVLINICKSISPLLPFTTEYIWQGLNNN